MKKITLLLLIAINFSTNTLAKGTGADTEIGECKSNYCTGSIEAIIIDPNTDIYIDLALPTGELTDCKRSGALTLKNNHSMHEEIYSLLLSTRLAGKFVKIGRAGTIFAQCEISFVELIK